MVALGICGAYGIRPDLIDEVADEIIWAMYRAPPGRAQAAAHKVARRRLARQLRVPVRKVPVLHSCGIETEALRVIGAGGMMVAAYAAAARSSGSFILAGAAAVAAYGGALVLFGAVPLHRIRQCQAAFKVPGLGRLPRAVHK